MPVIPLTIPFLWLAAFAVAYGMLAAYRGQSEEADGSIKGLLLWLADVIGALRVGIPGHSVSVFGFAADAIRWVANSIENALAAVVSWFEAPVAAFWYMLAEVPAQTARSLAGFATATAHTIARLRDVAIPAAIAAAIAGPLSAVAALRHSLAYVRSVALPELRHGLDWTRGRVKRVEREAGRTARRLRRAEAYLTAAGFVVIVASALARLGLKWVRCRNVGKVGRRVCAMDFDLLDSLLAGTLLLTSPISLERLTRELLEQADDVEAALRYGFAELRELPTR